MNQDKKHRRILLLMITSQLLLIIFVVQWLISQFNNEKEILQNRLTDFYINIQDEIVDTMLFRSYVVPVIGQNQVLIKGIQQVSSDTLHSINISTSKPETQKGEVSWKGSAGAITIKLKHGSDSVGASPDTIRIRKVNDDMLIRSVRMIVAHTTDSAVPGKELTETFTINPDTSVFIDHFHRRIEGSGMNFRIEWLMDSGTSSGRVRKKALLINPFTPFSLPGVSIERYSGYLIRVILPQIIFGSILIIITALAFMVSYRNIRSQAVLNSLRNEMVGNITHELKTPVATLSVALESLNRYNIKNEPQKTEEYLRLAGLETKRLEELINRILDNTLLESGQQALDKRSVSLNELVREVAEETRSALYEKGSLILSLCDEPLTVTGDPLFLKGVLLNLIDNSIRYCDKRPEINIFSGKDKKTAWICVSDNGPGIPEQYQKKIFEKFFRLPSSNIHNVKGYGLGLSFVSQVMKLHNGSVEVKNLDMGCSFTIKIPLS